MRRCNVIPAHCHAKRRNKSASRFFIVLLGEEQSDTLPAVPQSLAAPGRDVKLETSQVVLRLGAGRTRSLGWRKGPA